MKLFIKKLFCKHSWVVTGSIKAAFGKIFACAYCEKCGAEYVGLMSKRRPQ
jgi:hypothetical protein